MLHEYGIHAPAIIGLLLVRWGSHRLDVARNQHMPSTAPSMMVLTLPPTQQLQAADDGLLLQPAR